MINKEYVLRMAQLLLPSKSEELEYETSVVRLGTLGWSAPVQFWHKLTIEFANPAHTADQVNEAFVTFYTDQGNARLLELIDKHLLGEPILQPWHETLRDCRESFLAGRYLVLVPALITVMEGVLALKIGTFTSTNVKLMAPTKAKAQQPTAFRLNQSIWLSISSLIDQLYQPVDFSGPAPNALNRHWILHGRSTSKDARHDSLRLFNLLGSLSVA